MANHLYSYDPSSYGAAAAAVASSAAPSSTAPSITSLYNSRALTESYLASSRYFASAAAAAAADPTTYSDPSMYHLGAYSHYASTAASAAAASHYASSAAGFKRPTAEALYHQTLLGSHNTYGQTDAWLNEYLAKRPKYESASRLQIYPQRPGEKDCAHYMQTRTCMYGDSCKFDHPHWVPEGGIPDWKEVSLVTTESLPEKPGEPDCPYFMKTQRCMYGSRCKFNHPRDKTGSMGAPGSVDFLSLPERPSEPPCAFYLKTGTCRFGGTCRFHHPKDIPILSVGQENASLEQLGVVTSVEGLAVVEEPAKPSFQVTPAPFYNSKGLPIRPGEVECPFYLKTGSCKYSATCRYSHPDINVISAPAAATSNSYVVPQTVLPSLNVGTSNPGISALQHIDSRLTTSTLGLVQTIYPQRPGQMECDYYMKKGVCKFGEKCRFNHPLDRTVPSAKVEEPVTLTLAGFPRRVGAIICPYYLKTGLCKYGPTCRFDHPPPGEAMAMAASQATTTNA